MLYNARQSYTPALEPYEFNDRALIVDTETVGAGPAVEIVIRFQPQVRIARVRKRNAATHRIGGGSKASLAGRSKCELSATLKVQILTSPLNVQKLTGASEGRSSKFDHAAGP